MCDAQLALRLPIVRWVPRLRGLAVSTREGSVFTSASVASTDTEVSMSERGSASLFEIVFYCVGLFALLIWSFGHVKLPW